MSECRRFLITGRVQGVWFRESTRREAVPLGITGHAANCPDGSVEVLACGSSEALDHLAEWLRRGPPMAEVTDVASEPAEADCPQKFKTGWRRDQD